MQASIAQHQQPRSKAARPFPFSLLAFGERVSKLIRWVARGWGASRTIVFLAMAGQGGIPQSPVGGAWEAPVQLGLLVMLDIGGFLSWKWEGAGAAVITAGAILLGIFSAVEYAPLYAFGVMMAFLLPGVLLWLDWQRRQSMRAILLLAAVLMALFVVGGLAAWQVNSVIGDPT